MEEHSIHVKDLTLLDRPREKLLREGAAQLSDSELVAILFGSGTKGIPLMSICSDLLNTINNDLCNLLRMNVDHLSKIKGIGTIKAIRLLAALEIGKRAWSVKKPLLLKKESDIRTFMTPYYTDKESISYFIILLNHRDELLAISELDLGKDQLPQLKSIVKLTLEAGAAAFLICRNEFRIPEKILNKEKVFIAQLDAAAGMLCIKMNGFLVIDQEISSPLFDKV